MRAGAARRFPISVGRGCSGYAKGSPTKKKSLTGKSGKAQPVPPTGIEPVRCFHRGILSPLRLPVPPRRLTVWYCSAKRGNCQSAKSCRPECKKANGLFAANGKAARFMWQCPAILWQYRIILSADTASEVRQMPSQKHR